MNNNSNNKLTLKSLIIDYRPVLLHFHRNFTTAHSTTTTRTNFFIRVKCNGNKQEEIYGFGECGLPPKKPGCYMSDIEDCLEFMGVVGKKVGELGDGVESQFSFLPEAVRLYFQNLSCGFKMDIIKLLKICNQLIETEHYRAPKCALQFALLDLVTKSHHRTLTSVLFPSIKSQHTPSSFYTISFESNEQMLDNARQHLSITTCIKIKYGRDIKQLIKLLKIIEKEQIGQRLIIDANCSWLVEDMVYFIEGVKDIANYEQLIKKIVYIEQPFDLQITDIQKWQEMKSKSPFKILADESFRNELDIQRIQRVAHAVNIKSEKAGGPFAVWKAALKANESGLQVMFGTMCCTQLGCSQTFQFYPLAEYLDIDGALLVKMPQLKGGFKWRENGEVVPDESGGFGMGVDASEVFLE